MTLPEPSRVFLFRGAEILLRAEGPSSSPGCALPDSGLLEGLRLSGRRDYPAGGLACVAARLAPDMPDAELSALGLAPLPFRTALAELPGDEAARAAKGLGLLNWLESARHCGACGAELSDDGKEGYRNGARSCGVCGKVFYPRVSPAVIVLVHRGDKVLLAHNAAFPADRFGLVAGFVEPGESIEQTARRELAEEAAIEVRELRYVESQPWPFPDSLMLAMEAEWAAGEGRPDGVEITELRWCGPSELPSIPPPGSVARRLIDGWLSRSLN